MYNYSKSSAHSYFCARRRRTFFFSFYLFLFSIVSTVTVHSFCPKMENNDNFDVEESNEDMDVCENNENIPCPATVATPSNCLHTSMFLGGPCAHTTPLVAASAPPKQNKKKKAKGRNGNIYIGVANRILWLQLQEKFGFENINNFGNFVMSYMTKVYDDFDMLHQVAVDIGMFEPQGLAGFQWVNGLPHPVNEIGEFIQLPEIQMSEEYSKRAFEITYDLCVKRGKFLVDLASGIKEEEPSSSEVQEQEQPETISQSQECKKTPGKILGDITLDSINSPENFATPNNYFKNEIP